MHNKQEIIPLCGALVYDCSCSLQTTDIPCCKYVVYSNLLQNIHDVTEWSSSDCLLGDILNNCGNLVVNVWINRFVLKLSHDATVENPSDYCKLSQKRNAKVVNYDNSVCRAFFFLLSVCTTFSEGHRTLHFQKWFKSDHFLFAYGLVYHFAYFVQNNLVLLASHKWKFTFKVCLKWHQKPKN